LDVQGLCKSYRGFRLENASFSLPTGFVMGLIGPNGAGKTTLIRLIMNLIRPNAGQIRVFGLDHQDDEVAIRSRIGFVYDTPCYDPGARLHTIARTLAPFYPTWDEQEFDRLMCEFELPHHKKFKSLSHGMTNKFALALALAHHPDLLVMDEPTSGLDPVFRHELIELLRDRMGDGRLSILFSTHITTDLERFADYITSVRKGRIVFSQSRDDILDSWSVVKGGTELLNPALGAHLKGVQRGIAGVRALTHDINGLRPYLSGGTAVERASLDDIMVFLDSDDEPATLKVAA
jgi:ABC-2 type transport system ATP-binding protein